MHDVPIAVAEPNGYPEFLARLLAPLNSYAFYTHDVSTLGIL